MRNLAPQFILDKFEQGQTRGSFSAVSLFVDLSGFTTLTEELMKYGKEAAEALADVLTQVFEPLVGSVYNQYGTGFITGFAGDAFLALFPRVGNQTYLRALRAAYDIQTFMAANPSFSTPHGSFNFGVKIGLADGIVEWGILSSKDKAPLYTYYFKGDAVDRSAFAEHHAKEGELIINKNVYRHIKELITVQAIDGEYYRITSVEGELPRSGKPHVITSNPETEALFLPTELAQLSVRGEFRNVITSFLILEEVPTHDQIAEFVKIVFQLMKKYGGFLGKLDFGDKGCNMLFFWGTPISYENDVDRALNFILDLREQSPLVFKAGVTYRQMYAGFAGSSQRGEYTCYGRGINLAARLMMTADWGDLWLDRETARHAGRRFEVGYVGKFTFKGFEEKQPVFHLTGRMDVEQSSMYRRDLIEMVGRQHELEKLQQFIQPIFEKKFGGISYIYGEAGIGKSRLVREFEEICHDGTGVAPTWFHCPADEILRQNLNPFRHFLKEYFHQSYTLGDAERKARFDERLDKLIADTTDSHISKELQRTRTFLGALIGLYWPGSLYDHLDPKLRFENTLRALENFIKATSLLRPVILELEDAHWIDKDSLAFVKQLMATAQGFPIAILAISRTSQTEELPLQDLSDQVIDLTPLSGSNIKLFAESMLGKPIADSMVSLLENRTEGNPFFVEQMLLFLQEENLLQDGPDGLIPRSAANVIPGDVRAVLIARLDRLSSRIKRTVQTAAILGQEFEMSVLSHMLKTGGDVQDDVKVAEQEAIWQPISELRYLFKHALMRDTVYDMQLQSQRRELHQIAAEAYEQIYAAHQVPHYAEIAYHYERADVVHKAVQYWEKAGNLAKDNFHNELAIRYYDKLINYLAPVVSASNRNELKSEDWDLEWALGKLIDSFLGKGQIHEVIGEWDAAQFIYEQVQSLVKKLGDKRRISKVKRRMGWMMHLLGENDAAMEYYQAALEISEELGDKKEVAVTTGKMGNIHHWLGDYEQAMTCFKKDLQISAELEDQLGISIALNNMGNVYRRLGDYDRAMACYEQKIKLNEEMDDKKGLSVTIGNMGSVYFDLGDYRQAKACYEKYLSLSEELGDKLMLSIALYKMGNIYQMRGDYIRAMSYYERRLQLSQELGDKKGILRTLGTIGQVNTEIGDTANALDAYDQAIEMSRQLGIKTDLARSLTDKAELLFNLKKYEPALQLNREGQTMAEIVNEKDILFKSKILAAKLSVTRDDERNPGDIRATEGYYTLEQMLEETSSPSEQAELNYQLWKLSGDSVHHDAALELYEALSEKAPRFEYKKRIDELTQKIG